MGFKKHIWFLSVFILYHVALLRVDFVGGRESSLVMWIGKGRYSSSFTMSGKNPFQDPHDQCKWSEKRGGAPKASQFMFLHLLSRAREDHGTSCFPTEHDWVFQPAPPAFRLSPLGRLQSRYRNMVTECGIRYKRTCNWRASLWRQTLMATGCLCREKSSFTAVSCLFVVGDTKKTRELVLGLFLLVFRYKLQIWPSRVDQTASS